MSQDSDPFFDPLDIPEPEIPKLPRPLLPKEQEPQLPAQLPTSELIAPERQKHQMIPIETKLPATDEQKEYLDKAIIDACLYGTDAAALVCHGDGQDRAKACPFLKKCPLYKAQGAKALPLDEPCPIEKAIMMNYIHMVAKEMEIDPGDPTYANDLILIQQRAGLKLMMHRASIFMSEDPVLEKIVETDNGRFKTKLITGNMNMDYIMRALSEDRKLADSSVSTRKSKAQLSKAGFKDKSKQAADVQARIRRQIEMTEKTIKLDPATGVPLELIQVTKYKKEDKAKD